MKKLLLAIVDRFVPPALASADPLTREQARLTVGFTLAVSMWGPFFIVFMIFILESLWLVTFTVLANALSLVALYCFYRSANFQVAGNILCLLFFAELFAFGLYSGGLESNALTWSMAVPLVGSCISGIRTGMFWTGAVVAQAGLFLILDRQGVRLPNMYSPDEVAWIRFGTMFSMTIMLTSLAAVYEIFKDRAIKAAREASREAIESTASLGTILDHATDGIITIDAEGTIRSVNAAAGQIFGYEAEELIGKNAAVFMSKDQQDVEWEPGVRREVVGRRKDGTTLYLEISVSPSRMQPSNLFTGIIRDVTVSREARRQLLKEQKILKKLLAAHEMERQLLAYEIHDGLVQHMTGALMHLESEQDEEGEPQHQRVVNLLRDSIREARRLISGLRPPIIDELGLAPAIDYLVREFEAQDGPRVELECEVDFDRLEPLLESSLFRICQEGLNNIRKHSRAKHVQIHVNQIGKRLRLMVQDDGVGFDPGQVTEQSFGLEGIRQRAKLLGGRALIESGPGGPTRILVDVPLSLPAEGDSDLSDSQIDIPLPTGPR